MTVADPFLSRRLRLAYPFTILTDAGIVRLVAGEDYRYTLTSPELDRWLPAMIAQLTGKEPLARLLEGLDSTQRESALQIVQQLLGERVLVDGAAADAHLARSFRIELQGTGRLRELLEAETTSTGQAPLVVLCQDRLDYEETLALNRRCREAMTPFLWASYGAMNRAYVSPLFLPDAGPCFGCLLRSFQRLSPAPEIYDALRDHTRRGRSIAATDFPREGLLILQGMVLWKLQQAAAELCDPALYRLHVLERANFEVTTHRVFADPLCAECRPAGKSR
jgi:bacteriocin biosynthesis cyclodehydratase domain-containing protein